MNNSLKHYGIKGQKKGVRLYQNEDGTYTPEGLERYFGSKKKDGQVRYRNGKWSYNGKTYTSKDLEKILPSTYTGSTNQEDLLLQKYDKNLINTLYKDAEFATKYLNVDPYTDRYTDRLKTGSLPVDNKAILGYSTVEDLFKYSVKDRSEYAKLEKDISKRRETEKFDEKTGLYLKSGNSNNYIDVLKDTYINNPYAVMQGNTWNTSNNCNICAMSFLLRRLGYDTYANASDFGIAPTSLTKPSDSCKALLGNDCIKYECSNEDWYSLKDNEEYGYNNYNSTIIKNIKNNMDDNDIGMIYIVGHAMNVVKINGVVYIVDSQSQIMKPIDTFVSEDLTESVTKKQLKILSCSIINKDKININSKAAKNISHKDI